MSSPGAPSKRGCPFTSNTGSRRSSTGPAPTKAKHRKVCPEQLQEAIEQVLGEFRDTRYNKMMIYRRCIERGVLVQSDCSQTSFFRLVRHYDLLTPLTRTDNKRRLAFSKQYANEMWQMDTLIGPYVKNGGHLPHRPN